MSGDTQPKKRKDKKRKKDDEDTVKETTVHAPKQTSAGAAQAAKEPGDIQMHIHSDHGTGGHWCAKIVFFVLLAGLGALIGLILMESQGVSNDDTPLSESRYSEFFNGWVDETRQDDHHHDEVLAAINSLDDHDDDGGDDHHAVDDHDDDDGDGHDQDGDDDHDDGAPYAEEEDHDDEDGTDLQDDEDEGPAQKLDDDEVEEIFIQQEAAARQEAAAAAEDDDGDDDDDDGQEDEDDDDDDAEPVLKNNAAAGNTNAKDADDDDDDDVNDIADDDDDQDDTPFDEEESNALNEGTNQKLRTLENSSTNEDTLKSSVQNSRTSQTDDREPEQNQAQPSPTTPSTEEAVTGDTLKDQMDELVRNYNKLAESLDVPKVDDVPVDTHETVVVQDEDDDGDAEEIEEVTRGSQTANDDDADDGDDDDNVVDDDDDDRVAFGEFVDNDGGEEEYLEKVRTEQQRRTAAEEERRAAAEPVEESSQIPSRAEEADRSYQEELRRAEQQLDENKPQEALTIFDRIILRKPNSIAALIGRARCLDALAEQRRSNSVLTEAITAYRKVIEQELAVDDETLKTVAERCIDRMRFQGQHAKAVEVHKVLIRRFDNEPLYRNQLAVSYLYMNRLAEAKAVLHETLHRWIDDGFALVHYGFVLKTLDQDMELAAQYLQEGIETDQPGTQNGRFYFQLGDALQRLGRNREALDVYRKGVQRKLFLSLYQRSLYNVEGLRSRPFWTEEQTTYATELEIIRAQWELVRDEGLKLLNSAGVFVNESENLRDRGDWKQLELFSRGTRVERNCARASLTCRLVEQYFPAARTCKRGQVKFSVMHPGTHVWPHCGPTNCRIRAHLGLSVPPGTYIRVAEETRSWEDGKWLIFDDSFEHEVWHNGTETRLVLIVDFWHPDLTESQRRSLSPI